MTSSTFSEQHPSSKIGWLNINGLKNEVIISTLHRLVIEKQLDVVFLAEPFLSPEKEVVLKKIFAEFDVFIRARKKKKTKLYQLKGGIICLVRKNTGKLEKKQTECDDVLWVHWNHLKLTGAYFVPHNSPFVGKNEKTMTQLQQRILENERERVIVLADANAWIGELPSVVKTKTEDGTEIRELVLERKTKKKATNKQGEWFVTSMNNTNMSIVNGLLSPARHTYIHPGKEARSIVDFVVVNEREKRRIGHTI